MQTIQLGHSALDPGEGFGDGMVLDVPLQSVYDPLPTLDVRVDPNHPARDRTLEWLIRKPNYRPQRLRRPD